MAKRRVGRYPKAFKQMAVERLPRCENIVALSRKPGVSRRLLYTWRDQLDPVERSGAKKGRPVKVKGLPRATRPTVAQEITRPVGKEPELVKVNPSH